MPTAPVSPGKEGTSLWWAIAAFAAGITTSVVPVVVAAFAVVIAVISAVVVGITAVPIVVIDVAAGDICW